MYRLLILLQTLLLGVLVGCSDSATNDDEKGPEKSKQTIVWTPETPVKGSAVSFTIEGETDNIRMVLWTFGDKGTVSAQANQAVEHTYTTAGTYTVSAYISWTTASMTEVSASVVVADSEATILCSNSTPARMESVQFSLNALPNITSVVWNFGDQSATQQAGSATETVAHQFAADGTYQVQAVAKDAKGTVLTLSQAVSVVGKSLSYACQNFDRSKVWIMAHRGNYKGGYDLAPNSLSGYRKCVELGYVDFIETDAQITKDGQVICLHDNYLSRFTNYSNYASDQGYVANLTLDEIRKYKLKTTDGVVTSETVPTLEEVLTEFRGKVWFNIDKCSDTDKDVETISKIYEVVKRCGSLDRVQFYVSNGGTVNAKWLSEQAVPAIIAPHANTEGQMSTMTTYQPYYMIQTSTATLVSSISWLSTVNARGLSVTNLLDSYSTDFLGGNTAVMDSFVNAGLNMIQCDYPPEMYTYLQKKGKR